MLVCHVLCFLDYYFSSSPEILKAVDAHYWFSCQNAGLKKKYHEILKPQDHINYTGTQYSLLLFFPETRNCTANNFKRLN